MKRRKTKLELKKRFLQNNECVCLYTHVHVHIYIKWYNYNIRRHIIFVVIYRPFFMLKPLL